MRIEPTGEILGASVHDIDLSHPIDDAAFRQIAQALGDHGVICFKNQNLEPEAQKAFAARFGTLEINVAAGPYTVPGHPEVMILSNRVEDGRPVGLGDAGQGWHTDMSYSKEIAFANVLYAIEIPRRNGRPLGSTLFANMHAAFTDLPDDLKARLVDKEAIHDFEKFWEMMRARPGSTRGPLTDEQRAKKPPVPHPIFLTHPITGTKVLYCNPGYATRIVGMDENESDDTLNFLFEHQLQEKYQYAHQWTEGDVLMWENIGTLHNAISDYGPDEPRYIRRCQIMADKVFEPSFVAA
ncbi:MAG: TauD/TfdA family dioxygenase [Alphaproteobacteria bacterium]|nr:TauD/TfdA family dioxygenase [Alphaproteobacteria bacterium]